MKRLRVLAGLPVVPPLGQEWGVIELQNKGKMPSVRHPNVVERNG